MTGEQNQAHRFLLKGTISLLPTVLKPVSGFPGFGVLTPILLFVVPLSELSPGATWLRLAAALLYLFLAYRMASVLDLAIFDLIFGARQWERKCGKKLAQQRKCAAKNLTGEEDRIVGIYALAESAFSGSKDWLERVATWLEISKAARALFVPFLFLGLGNICGWFEHGTMLNSNDSWYTFAIVAAISAIGFALLRIYAEAGIKGETDPTLARRKLAKCGSEYAVSVALLFVLLASGVYQGWFDFSNRDDLLTSATFTFIVSGSGLLLFVWFRVIHMKELYAIVIDAQPKQVRINAQNSAEGEIKCLLLGQRIFPERDWPTPTQDVLRRRAYPKTPKKKE